MSIQRFSHPEQEVCRFQLLDAQNTDLIHALMKLEEIDKTESDTGTNQMIFV
jgi:hypothetical protein